MSTQRRARRTSLATKIRRGELRFRRNQEHMGRAEVRELRSAYDAHLALVRFGGVTAPLMSLLWLAWEWLATKFLLSDYRSETFAGLGSRRSSSPCGTRGPSESIPRAIPRSSPLHIPHSPARTRLNTTLPHAPVGKVHRAERHDGKR